MAESVLANSITQQKTAPKLNSAAGLVGYTPGFATHF